MNRPHYKTEYQFKVLVIGEASTGKTSFIRRYVHSFFSSAYQATIGVDYAQKNLELDRDTLARLQIWDIAGQERFAAMSRVYYRDAVGAFIVFDANQPKTFASVLKWKRELDTKVALADGSRLPCVLLANKCDLIIKTEEAERELAAFAKQHAFAGHFYTSPKTDQNIERAVRTLVESMVAKHQSMELDDSDEGAATAAGIVRVAGSSGGSAHQRKLHAHCCQRSSSVPLGGAS